MIARKTKTIDHNSIASDAAIRIDYLKLRLDHTISHLQAASKLMYLVDGAVLAFVYFVINAFGLSRGVAAFVAAITLILAGVNFLHSRFILTQQHWYRQLDQRIRQILVESDLEPVPEGRHFRQLFTSSHRNLKHVHVWITWWLVLVCALLMLYSFGVFPEIQMRNMGRDAGIHIERPVNGPVF